MFVKVCIFLLLGSTFVLANPVQDNRDHALVTEQTKFRGIFGTVKAWLKAADDAIGGVFGKVTAPFKKAVQLLVETGEGVMDYSKEKIEQLVVAYYEIKSKSEESLNAAKNNFILKLISELQRVIDVLNKQADAETLEKLKQKNQEIAESSKEALKNLQQQLQEAIEAEKKKLEENLEQWKQEADNATKRRKFT